MRIAPAERSNIVDSDVPKGRRDKEPVGTIIRKVKVTIDAINPQINVTSWQEVADF